MSKTILIGFTNDYIPHVVSEYKNSFLFVPYIWMGFACKYLPDKDGKKIFGEDSAIDKINTIMENSENHEEMVLWEFAFGQLCDVKDKQFVAECIRNFVHNAEYGAFEPGVQGRFEDIAHDIENLSNKYRYFILDPTSLGEGPESLAFKMDENTCEDIPVPLFDWPKKSTELIRIDTNKIVEYVDVTLIEY